MTHSPPSPPRRPRPLSPHLQIYRPMLTMMMSIVHRLTGMALYLGTVLLVAWMIALAAGPGPYNAFLSVAETTPATILLIAYTWALIHHMLGGLRHLLWDTGRGFSLPVVEITARVVLAASVLLTAALWSARWTL